MLNRNNDRQNFDAARLSSFLFLTVLLAGIFSGIFLHYPVYAATGARTRARSDNQKAQALMATLERSIDAATGFRYNAVMSIPVTVAGAITVPRTYTIECVERKPSWQRQIIRQNGQCIGVIVCGRDGGLFYDPVSNRYLRFHTPVVPADYRAVHGALDSATESSLAGNFFDTTLINHPMLTVADQYDRDSTVRFGLTNVVVRGQRAYRITSATTGNGQSLSEATCISRDFRLLGYRVTATVAGNNIVVCDEQFTSLKLLRSSPPPDTFSYKLPSGASPFTPPADSPPVK